jgi:ribosomal protein L19E
MRRGKTMTSSEAWMKNPPPLIESRTIKKKKRKIKKKKREKKEKKKERKGKEKERKKRKGEEEAKSTVVNA